MASVKKRAFLLTVLVLLVVAGVFGWRWLFRRQAPPDHVTLYGNIDIRQLQLAFNDSERIDKLFVDEGAAVHAGQLVAQLVQRRFLDTVARDQANVAAQQQVVGRLLAGSRPEEIAAARADTGAAQADAGVSEADAGTAQADVDAAQANLTNAELLYHRQQALAEQQYVSLQVRDDAQRASLAAQADLAGKRQALAAKRKAVAARQQALAAKQQALQLAVLGPRKEDIAAAQAMVKSLIAALALAQKELADTQLFAPADGVIQERILEPGDMVSPQTRYLPSPWTILFGCERTCPSLNWVK